MTTTDGTVLEVNNPQKFPEPSAIEKIDEPIIDATMITREEYIGEILKLLEENAALKRSLSILAVGA